MPGVERTETPIVPPTSVSRRPSTVNSCSLTIPDASDMRHASYSPPMYDDRHNRRRCPEETAMPMIEVTAPEGTIAPEAREELLEELAGRLLHWEGAPDTEFFRSISWVYFNEIAADGLYVGGRSAGERRVRVEVTTPEGALSQRRRAGLVADVHAAVSRVAGIAPDDGLHVWVLCREIAEGSWGAGGAIVEFEKLRAASKAERERTEEPAPA